MHEPQCRPQAVTPDGRAFLRYFLLSIVFGAGILCVLGSAFLSGGGYDPHALTTSDWVAVYKSGIAEEKNEIRTYTRKLAKATNPDHRGMGTFVLNVHKVNPFSPRPSPQNPWIRPDILLSAFGFPLLGSTLFPIPLNPRYSASAPCPPHPHRDPRPGTREMVRHPRTQRTDCWSNHSVQDA